MNAGDITVLGNNFIKANFSNKQGIATKTVLQKGRPCYAKIKLLNKHFEEILLHFMKHLFNNNSTYRINKNSVHVCPW